MEAFPRLGGSHADTQPMKVLVLDVGPGGSKPYPEPTIHHDVGPSLLAVKDIRLLCISRDARDSLRFGDTWVGTQISHSGLPTWNVQPSQSWRSIAPDLTLITLRVVTRRTSKQVWTPNGPVKVELILCTRTRPRTLFFLLKILRVICLYGS